MLLQGILLGISLSFLIGPLLFAVVQAGIAQGFRAGIAVAAGIWASDLVFVAIMLGGVEFLASLIALSGFRFWAGFFGGLLLVAFGASGYFSKANTAQSAETPKGNTTHKNYLRYWIKGFLLNTINPGTIFFWLGIVSALVVPNGWNRKETLTFFGGMLSMLILTDVLKAWAAKRIRKWLTPKHINQVQKGIGLLLIVFGLVLIFRAFAVAG